MINDIYIKLIKIYNDSLIKNSIYLITTNISSLILGFFFWIIVTRYYTPHDIGIVSVILSSISLISMISSIGLPVALIFYLPRDNKNAVRRINSCIITSIIISFIFSLIYILEFRIWMQDSKYIIGNVEGITIFIIIAIAMTISILMSGAFTAGKRTSFHMTKEIIFDIVKIFSLALFTGVGTIGILISWGIGLIIAVAIGFFLLFKVWRYSPMLTFDPIIKDMIGFSAGNYVAGILYSIPRLILPIMIASLISTESTAYFFIAITIASLLYGISQSTSNSLLAESFNRDKLWNNVSNAIRFNIVLLFPGLLFFVIFGKFVLNLFNHSYADNATVTLIILATASIPISAINIFNTVRNAQKRVGSTIKINAIVAIITLILAIPLMKILNIEGAALAYLIGNTVGAIIVIIRIKNPAEFTLKLLKVKNDVISI